jgi:anti-sigma factor RsiW
VTCREFVEFLMAYLDGELPAEQRRVFEAHMEVCAACVNYLASYEATVALGRRLAEQGEASLPEDVPEELVDAILAARRRDDA